MRRLMERAAEERPLVVVLDDVHWAEPGFLDLVEHVADWSRDAPILLLCVARPELLERRPGWGGGKLNAATVLLEPLAPEESDELIDGLLDGSELDRGASRAGSAMPPAGTPLRGGDARDGARARDRPERPTDDSGAARSADRPAAPVRARSARTRGGRGTAVPPGRRPGARPEEPALASHLVSLVRKELVRPAASLLPGDDAFRFRHLLIRDAAYEALSKATRAELHELFAGWIAERGADLVELDEILGYHLEQAARYRAELGTPSSEVAARAATHLAAAGTRALERSDFHAAANLHERATSLLEPDDPLRARLLPALAEAVYGTGEYARSLAVMEEAIELGERLGEESSVARPGSSRRTFASTWARHHTPTSSASSMRSSPACRRATTICCHAHTCREPGS